MLNQWQCLLLTFSFSVAISLFLSSPAYNKWIEQRKNLKPCVEGYHVCFFTLTMINNSSFILSDVCWEVKRQSSENESVSLVLVMTSWSHQLHSPQLLTHSSLPSHEISNITVCWNVPYMKYVTWKVVISLTSFCESFVFLFLVGKEKNQAMRLFPFTKFMP